MLKENKEPKSSQMTWIGLMLICLFVSFYLYYYPKSKGNSELYTIIGTLAESPEYVDMGENPDFISIQLKEDNINYQIEGCGLNSVNNNVLFSLHPNDYIKLTVDKKDHADEKLIFNSGVRVFEIELIDTEKILKLSDINNCEKIAWQRILWLSPFIGIGLFISLYNRIKNKR